MTPYEKLKTHLSTHKYIKGANKGDAPADPDKRGKDHFRVTQRGSNIAVRMWNTNILTVSPDNRITLDTGGWWTSTTKQNLNEALHRFLGWGSVGSRVVFNMLQPCVVVKYKAYRFYDGMEFSAEGELLSSARCFQRKQTNREETAEFRKDVADSGFKDVWPVLFAAAEPNHRVYVPSAAKLAQWVTRECHVNEWPDIAAKYKAHYEDHKTAYAAIVRVCTQDMTELVDTDVTVV